MTLYTLKHQVLIWLLNYSITTRKWHAIQSTELICCCFYQSQFFQESLMVQWPFKGVLGTVTHKPSSFLFISWDLFIRHHSYGKRIRQQQMVPSHSWRERGYLLVSMVNASLHSSGSMLLCKPFPLHYRTLLNADFLVRVFVWYYADIIGILSFRVYFMIFSNRVNFY